VDPGDCEEDDAAQQADEGVDQNRCCSPLNFGGKLYRHLGLFSTDNGSGEEEDWDNKSIDKRPPFQFYPAGLLLGCFLRTGGCVPRTGVPRSPCPPAPQKYRANP
jgi:hypothetical protein